MATSAVDGGGGISLPLTFLPCPATPMMSAVSSTGGSERGVQSYQAMAQSPNAEISSKLSLFRMLKQSKVQAGIVQNRTLSATNINYDDLSYAVNNSLRSSTGYGSASASSSIGLAINLTWKISNK
ncbi:hypothetical protein R3W88_014379 [Solanum pinnatisectum]|uniref:Uncharacterized protein n=1 Tax=Solanum pinnatisectum TaxID=50273 RepID=A0AAV9KS29_9SOLN|nr:hypothetical protein R3W88_014379 [Solanum pinnatisectum]